MIDFDDVHDSRRPANSTPPHLWARGVGFEDISVVSEKAPSHISGPDTCLAGLTLRNVTLGGSNHWLGCRNVDLSSLTLERVSPPLTCTGCNGWDEDLEQAGVDDTDAVPVLAREA